MNKLIIPAIIIFAAFTRLMPHPPNFTPIIAMGLFGGAYLKDKRWALMLPVVAMLLADLFLGFHGTMIWVYGSLIIITAMGFLLNSGVTLKNGAIATLGGSLLFFLVTNPLMMIYILMMWRLAKTIAEYRLVKLWKMETPYIYWQQMRTKPASGNIVNFLEKYYLWKADIHSQNRNGL